MALVWSREGSVAHPGPIFDHCLDFRRPSKRSSADGRFDCRFDGRFEGRYTRRFLTQISFIVELTFCCISFSVLHSCLEEELISR